jgi:hypothetical protein
MRQFIACKNCGEVSFYDYRPYGQWWLRRDFACTHVDPVHFREGTKQITKDKFLERLTPKRRRETISV